MQNSTLLSLVAAAFVSVQATAATCDFPGEPTGPSALRLTKIAEGFDRPVVIAFAPDRADTYYVVEQYGLMKAVIGGVVQRQPVLDLTDVIQSSGNETGFLGLAFHPRFAANRKFYINYTAKSPLRTVVSELRLETNGTVDPASERVLLTIAQPFSNHNGGNLTFGPDGYLYIGTGDGGSANDPQGHGQNLRSLLAKMLRIDVDSGTPYGIPADNPAFSDPQARREIFAYGLRNPWRFSFDRVTGELWVGDVGQNAFEEIDIVEKGGNYGWNTMEGNSCLRGTNCNRAGLRLPVKDYPRSEGASVTGGYVYRGSAMPALIGTYIYADYVSGRIWGLRHDGSRVIDHKLLLNSGINVSSFGEDNQGELYLLDHQGIVYKINLPTVDTPAAFPRTLTATGCFSSLVPLRPIDGIQPYDVSAALWSDGSAKERFVYVPQGQKIRLDERQAFQYPTGSVLIKNFYQSVRSGNRSEDKIIETRFLVKRAPPLGFQGYSYRWNDAATEATLLGGAATRDLVLATDRGDETYSYYFPSNADCARCHVPGSGGPLGFDAGHLNYRASGTDNQLTRLARAGILDAASLPSDLSTLPSYPNPQDGSVALDDRARSYLHTQCAQCHNRDFGAAQGNFDLRYGLSFAATGLCDAAPVAGDLGVPGARVLKPGAPEQSLLWLRTHSLAKSERMPPLATSRRDQAGVDLLQRWIASINGCP